MADFDAVRIFLQFPHMKGCNPVGLMQVEPVCVLYEGEFDVVTSHVIRWFTVPEMCATE